MSFGEELDRQPNMSSPNLFHDRASYLLAKSLFERAARIVNHI
jgi:uncharacterized membrane protein YfhO